MEIQTNNQITNNKTGNWLGEQGRIYHVACKTELSALILGPTGSGKSTVAHQIHLAGARSSKVFVTVNLASLSESLIESELFGHEKGSFTGANYRRIGKLEQANGGTLFLDEIGEMSPKTQARLLEFLQTKQVTLVGANSSRKVDVRIICATHKDIGRLVKNGEFRLDLYQRICGIQLTLPALSDRCDFDEIFHICLENSCKMLNKSILKIDESYIQFIEQYSWIGNLRELQHVLNCSVALAETDTLMFRDLPSWLLVDPSAATPPKQLYDSFDGELVGTDFNKAKAIFEKHFIIRRLRECEGRLNQSARTLNMSKTTLLEKLRKYQIDRKSFASNIKKV